MDIVRFGVIFTLVEAESPETLLKLLELRNKPFVRENMMFRDVITTESHLNWFHQLVPAANFYFLVQHNGEYVGVINIKNVEKGHRAELGIFFGQEEVIKSPLPIICALCLIDIATSVLRIEELYTHVAKGRDHIMNFNKKLGFNESERQADYSIYELDIDLHHDKNSKTRTAAAHWSKNKLSNDEVQILISKDESLSEVKQHLMAYNARPVLPHSYPVRIVTEV